MTLSDVNPDSLIAEITTAFDGVSRENGITLHEGEELDCHGSPEDLLKARQLDTDTCWQEVPDEWIGEFPSAFHFMDSKGLRYYLPAVMIWHFRHTHSESSSADCIRTLLIDERFVHRKLPELFSILTDAQRRATARWLLYYFQSAYHGAAQNKVDSHLLASPWEKYLVEQTR